MKKTLLYSIVIMFVASAQLLVMATTVAAEGYGGTSYGDTSYGAGVYNGSSEGDSPEPSNTSDKGESVSSSLNESKEADEPVNTTEETGTETEEKGGGSSVTTPRESSDDSAGDGTDFRSRLKWISVAILAIALLLFIIAVVVKKKKSDE